MNELNTNPKEIILNPNENHESLFCLALIKLDSIFDEYESSTKFNISINL